MSDERAQGLKVAEVMSTDVEFIDPDALVQEAATLMGEIDVGALPVGTPTRLDGVVTDRDILYRIVARGRSPADVAVREIMSRPVIACRPTDALRDAMDAMSTNHLRRLAVRGDDGAVIGWITLSDIARRLLVDSESLQGSLHAMTETGRS